MKRAMARYCAPMVLLAVLASAAPASAGYTYPPPFEPQRTLFWDFSTSNWQTPVTGAGPTWHGEGWTCDNTTYSTNLQWFDTVASWPGHQGLIGLDNSNGESTATSTVTFHINNFATPNPLKLLWLEGAVCYLGGGRCDGNVVLPSGYTWEPTSETRYDLNLGYVTTVSGEIRPNPDYEELSFVFSVPAGGRAYWDYAYMSTLCTVPEPSSLIALGTGFIGLGGLLLKRRRG